MAIIIEFHAGSLTIVVEPVSSLPSLEPFTVHLTRSEFLILKELASHQGEHLSKEHLTHIGWPHSYVGPNSLNMSIMSLRKKLSILGGFWEISTIQRLGYSLNRTVRHRHTQIKIAHFGQIGSVEY
ncbi:winged helix-turn-helix domain-containing protein [Vibrio owensii]|uniref:winged helix-turn-helix domain-containing protein n=1 Tax=Vibrio owensii TaxID=696485 RepID=UPI003AB04B75